MEAYRHRVQYYETDRMGITHHSNYIRFMEEARIDFMDQLGFPYAAMEEKGVISPVKAVSCEYRRPCAFGDEIRVTVSVSDFNGVVLGIKYQMENTSDGETVCEARSEHVFLNREGRFVRLKRDMPDFCAALEALIQEDKDPCAKSFLKRNG